MKFCQYSIAALMLILSGTAFTMERENSDVDEIVALVTFALTTSTQGMEIPINTSVIGSILHQEEPTAIVNDEESSTEVENNENNEPLVDLRLARRATQENARKKRLQSSKPYKPTDEEIARASKKMRLMR